MNMPSKMWKTAWPCAFSYTSNRTSSEASEKFMFHTVEHVVQVLHMEEVQGKAKGSLAF